MYLTYSPTTYATTSLNPGTLLSGPSDPYRVTVQSFSCGSGGMWWEAGWIRGERGSGHEVRAGRVRVQGFRVWGFLGVRAQDFFRV